MRRFPGVQDVVEVYSAPRRRDMGEPQTDVLALSDQERTTLLQIWRSPDKALWLAIRSRLMDRLYRDLRFCDPEKADVPRAQMALLDAIFGPEGGNGDGGLIGRTVALAAEKGFAPTEVGVANVE